MQDQPQPTTAQLRAIAHDALIALHRESNPMSATAFPKQCYLIEEGHYVGLRFVLDDCSVEWKTGEGMARVYRDGRLVNTVSITPDENRRAA